MGEWLHLYYGLIAAILGSLIYRGVIALTQQYYTHVYSMKNFPKTYLIRYMIVPIPTDDPEPEVHVHVPFTIIEETENESDHESKSDHESDNESSSDQNVFAYLGDSTVLRIAIITSPPTDVVKKIKQAVKVDWKKEMFQLVSYSELK
jgi:hypothetical protein